MIQPLRCWASPPAQRARGRGGLCRRGGRAAPRLARAELRARHRRTVRRARLTGLRARRLDAAAAARISAHSAARIDAAAGFGLAAAADRRDAGCGCGLRLDRDAGAGAATAAARTAQVRLSVGARVPASARATRSFSPSPTASSPAPAGSDRSSRRARAVARSRRDPFRRSRSAARRGLQRAGTLTALATANRASARFRLRLGFGSPRSWQRRFGSGFGSELRRPPWLGRSRPCATFGSVLLPAAQPPRPSARCAWSRPAAIFSLIRSRMLRVAAAGAAAAHARRRRGSDCRGAPRSRG